MKIGKVQFTTSNRFKATLYKALLSTLTRCYQYQRHRSEVLQLHQNMGYPDPTVGRGANLSRLWGRK